MERDRSLSSHENGDDDKSSDKTKRRNRREGFHAPVPIEAPKVEKQKGAEKRAEQSALDKALAELAVKKESEATEKTVAPPKEKKKKIADAEPVEPAQAEAASAEAAAVSEAATVEEDGGHVNTAEEDSESATEQDEAEETFSSRELRPNELSIGEGFIDLSGNAPLEERVIPLHSAAGEETSEATVAPIPAEAIPTEQSPYELPVADTPEPVAAEEPNTVDTPVFVPRPEQQYQAVSTPEPPRPHSAEAEPLVFSPPVEVLQPRPEDTYPFTDQTVPEFRADVLPEPATPMPRASGGEQPATKQDIEDALYYAEKQGQNRGVLAGLLVGGGYEHFKHRRREKRQEKQLKEQNKRLKQAQEQLTYSQQELHTAAQNRPESRFSAPGTPFWSEQQPGGGERLPAPLPEQALRQQAERLPAAPAEEPGERLEVPADHRLETSAWHTIEVDARTGRPVENPAFAYGQEYHHERQQESAHGAPQDKGDANDAGSEKQDGGATAEAAQNYLQQSSQIPSASTQGPPSATDKLKSAAGSAKDAAQSAGQSAQSFLQSSDGPIWPWIVALAVIVVLLAILL